LRGDEYKKRREERFVKLQKECPASWDLEKLELDQMICDIRESWSEASAASPDDFE
jgi:hypothetical protein